MTQPTPPGWYAAEGDPPGTQRYWDGTQWIGGPQVVGGATGLPAPGSPAVGAYELAGAGQRIIARIIDAFIFAIPTFIILAAVGGGSFEVNTTEDPGEAFLATLLGLALSFAYEVPLVALRGATLGKMAMGIGVATDTGELPPGWAPSVRRWLTNLVGIVPFVGSFASFVIAVVSLVFLFSDKERRTVWDRVANTRVVSTRA